MTVYKRDGSTIVQADAVIKLQDSTKQYIFNFIKKFPLNDKERRDLMPPTEKERLLESDSKIEKYFNFIKAVVRTTIF